MWKSYSVKVLKDIFHQISEKIVDNNEEDTHYYEGSDEAMG